MILTCPSCSTRYMAEGSRFAPSGRTVKCTNCGHCWFQGPPDASALQITIENDTYANPGSQLQSLLSEGLSRQGLVQHIGQIASWAALLLFVAVVVQSAYAYRVQIVQLWPKASVLYSTLGITVNTRGLDLKDVIYAQFSDEDLPVLAISGQIENITAEVRPVTPLHVSLRDNTSRELYDWIVPLPVSELDAGQSYRFETRLGYPPVDAFDIVVRFAAADEIE